MKQLESSLKGSYCCGEICPKGKNVCGKAEKRADKITEGKSSNKQTPPTANEAGSKATKRTSAGPSSKLAKDVDDIKQQLKQLTGSLANITPVITEIKSAYDNYNQAVDRESDDVNESEKELDSMSTSDPLEEPPKKKARKESSVLAGMAKVVNKPQQDGEDLALELSEFVKQLLSKGMSKESRDELMNKFPTPGNCKRSTMLYKSTQRYLTAFGRR